jgi:hypothetical protein
VSCRFGAVQIFAIDVDGNIKYLVALIFMAEDIQYMLFFAIGSNGLGGCYASVCVCTVY